MNNILLNTLSVRQHCASLWAHNNEEGRISSWPHGTYKKNAIKVIIVRAMYDM